MLYLRRILLTDNQFLRFTYYSTNSLLSFTEQKYYSNSKVPFQRNQNKKHKTEQLQNQKLSDHKNSYFLQNNRSSNAKVDGLIKRLLTFEDEIKMRRDQAQRTILFKIKTAIAVPQQLVHVLLSMGTSLLNVFFIGGSKDPFILVEFKSHQCVNTILGNTNVFDLEKCYPSTSRIVYFTGDRQLTDKNLTKFPIQDMSKEIQNYPTFPEKNAAKSLAEQIQNFYELNCLKDVDYRVRYFIASILDDTLKNLFKDVVFFPFGSSSNRFGNLSSDLDMFLDLSGHCLKAADSQSDNKHFFFMSKEKRPDDKFLTETLASLIAKVTPKLSVKKVVRYARVPIVNMEANIGMITSCDISSDSIGAFLMTKLFWTYSLYDSRVAPLVMIIRTWAMHFNITTKVRPCPNLTNYQITMLVLYYLIHSTNPVLVSMDKFVTNQVFTQDPSELERSHRNTTIMEPRAMKAMFINKNQMSLSELLRGFLEFYSKFDFDNAIIALTKNNNKDKVGLRLYIENPFDRMKNVAVNVSGKEIESFQSKCAFTENFLRTGNSSWQSKNLVDILHHIDKYKSSQRNAPSVNELLTREMHDYNY